MKQKYFNDNGFAIFPKFWFQSHHTNIVASVVQGTPMLKMTTLCSRTTLHMLSKSHKRTFAKNPLAFSHKIPTVGRVWSSPTDLTDLFLLKCLRELLFSASSFTHLSNIP